MDHFRFLKPASAALGTAALYVVTGKLGLLLAIPPGYATAVWLPSGIALGAVLLWGRPAALGVWLGSFLINLGVTRHAHPASAGPLLPILVAGGIGLAATAQAYVGARLIQRVVGLSATLVEMRDIFWFLALGGPVACLINASLSVALLEGVGIVPMANAPMIWLTWWIGDTIGVFVMVPLGLAAFGQPRAIWRPRLLPVGGALVLGMAVGVTFFAWVKFQQRISNWQIWAILVAGFSFTSLLGAFTLVLTGRTSVVEAKVAERTARLAELNQTLEQRVAQRTSELEAARREADAANQAKSAFLANISHEVRTPMNGILGLAEILGHSPLAPMQQEWVRTLHQSGESLLRLLNDVLDLSKIESGKLTLENTPFGLRQEMEETVKLMAVKAAPKGLHLRLDIDPHVPDALCGDALRLRQISLNLIGNAVKFTDSGSVAVEVALAGQSSPDGRVQLRLSVADTGVGIAQDQLSNIFNPFVQADSSISRAYGGTGLGLSICAHLAEAMGGHIWAENRPEGGSVFHVLCFFGTACAAPASAPAADAAGACGPKPARRVLLVEDSPVNQLVAQTLLANHGHHVTIANNGQEALDCLADQSFDVVLMDKQMPVMDGFEALRHLRAREAATGSPRHWVIAITASAMRDDGKICLDAGFDNYLSKPYRAKDLLAVVDACPAPQQP